jgi:LytS/YehU family sensor histidine kinase
VLGLIATSLLFKNQFNLQNGTVVFLEKFVLTLLISSLNITTGFILKGFISWYSNLRINEELEQKAKLTELALIESKLDPHFLFNTINNIDVLVTKDPETASIYLNKLSSILRFILYESKGRKININEEVDYIQQYIELQRIRTSNENFVSLTVSGDTNEIQIYPMTFIPFVENAFKHSTNKKLENAISIHLVFSDHDIYFKCSNKFNPSTKPTEGGLGNKLISRRLELLYPKLHSLQANKNKDTYTVELDITL